MSYTATFTKLKSGNWGVRVVGEHAEKGDTLNVRVKKKNGDESMFEGNVIWTGNDRNSGRPCYLLAPEDNGRGRAVRYGSGSRRGYAPRASAGHWLCKFCEEENPYSSSRCWECGGSR